MASRHRRGPRPDAGRKHRLLVPAASAWRFECGAVTYGPALSAGCSLLDGQGARPPIVGPSSAWVAGRSLFGYIELDHAPNRAEYEWARLPPRLVPQTGPRCLRLGGGRSSHRGRRNHWAGACGVVTDKQISDQPTCRRRQVRRHRRSSVGVVAAAVGERVQSTWGQWIVRPPLRCPRGNPLRPGRMLVGSIACSCARHLTWRCECGAVTYGPALAERCRLLDRPARVRG
jgi:hypothetical protein